MLGKAIDEAEALEIRRVLLEKRDRWLNSVPDLHFYVRVDGGRWTKQFLGLAANAAVCLARRPVLQWCAAYSFPKQAGFFFTRYGEEAANKLAEAYQSKGDFFYSLWLERAAGSYVYQYSEAEKQSYIAGPEWLDWACRDDLGEVVFREVHTVYLLVPVNP